MYWVHRYFIPWCSHYLFSGFQMGFDITVGEGNWAGGEGMSSSLILSLLKYFDICLGSYCLWECTPSSYFAAEQPMTKSKNSLRFLWKWVLRIKIRTETVVQTKIILIFYYFDATVYFFSRFSVKGVWEGLSEFIQYLIKLALVLTLARQWGIEGSENIYTREAQSQELLDHKI